MSVLGILHKSVSKRYFEESSEDEGRDGPDSAISNSELGLSVGLSLGLL
jgi:hypothetical protein